jgi:hypothetical protein
MLDYVLCMAEMWVTVNVVGCVSQPLLLRERRDGAASG